MAATYPSGSRSFTTKLDGPGNTINAEHVNSLQDEVTAVEQGLVTGLQHDLVPDANGTRSLGSSVLYWLGVFVRAVTSRTLALIDNAGAGTKKVTISITNTLTADRTLGINTGDANRTITLTGNATLSGTEAKTDANETITGVWTITGASGQLTVSGAVPGLYVSETDATANNKNWLIAVESEILTVQTRTDANAAVSNVVTVTRAGVLTTIGGITISSGNLNVTTGSINATASSINAGTLVTATSGFKEHGRSFNAGDSQTITHSAGNFVAVGGGTWTVASGDWQGKYRMLGDTIWFNFVVDASTIAGTVSEVRITLPNSYTAQEAAVFQCLIGDNTANPLIPGTASSQVGVTYIRAFKLDFSNFAASTDATYVYISGHCKVS